METYLESLSLLKGGRTLGGCRGLKYLPMQNILRYECANLWDLKKLYSNNQFASTFTVESTCDIF